MRTLQAALLAILFAIPALAQTPDPPATARALQSHDSGADRAFEDTQRSIDDVLWYHRLGDAARIEKYRIASSKPRREKNPNAQSAGNAIVFPVYVFSPRNLKGKAPLLVFAHGGVHGRLTIEYAHIFREALDRGFVIVSPEYRGSSDTEVISALRSTTVERRSTTRMTPATGQWRISRSSTAPA